MDHLRVLDIRIELVFIKNKCSRNDVFIESLVYGQCHLLYHILLVWRYVLTTKQLFQTIPFVRRSELNLLHVLQPTRIISTILWIFLALLCDFEDDVLCGFTSDHTADFNWTRSNSTSSEKTGPSSDHTYGSGKINEEWIRWVS